jgi:hypothetical protein
MISIYEQIYALTKEEKKEEEDPDKESTLKKGSSK